MDKKSFIEELGMLLKKYNVNEINGMTYDKDLLDDETIIVLYKNGSYRTIRVNCDSLSAMIIDIVKQGGLD